MGAGAHLDEEAAASARHDAAVQHVAGIDGNITICNYMLGMILRFNSRTGPVSYELVFPPRVVENDQGETSYAFQIRNIGAPAGATLTLTEGEVEQIAGLTRTRRRK